MPNSIQAATNFERGIESIESPKNIPSGLPERARGSTVGKAIGSSLKELWSFSTTESVIVASLEPKISDPELLTPSAYYPMASEALEILEARRAQSTDPKELQQLGKVRELLEQEQNMNQLLQRYRHSDLPG